MTALKNAQIWLPGYIKNSLRRRTPGRRVWLAFADHYEPLWKGANETVGLERVLLWRRKWPQIAADYHDSAGRLPIYTFFYPQEEYRRQFLEPLAEMTRMGIADVEIHIHHDGEGEQNFMDRMTSFVEVLVTQHGLLRREAGNVMFGFIHGNWALDNSRPDGSKCGLNNELSLLKKLGCYGDFTLPSAPLPTQTRMVNTIYWAVDDPLRPKSHDTGTPVEQSPKGPPGGLLMVPGPLGIRSKVYGLGDRWMPRLDTGELAVYDPPTRARIRLWLAVAPRIDQDIFIKLYTHGAQERNAIPLLSTDLRATLDLMLKETTANSQELYFVSAWQMRLAIEAVLNRSDPLIAVSTRGGVIR